VTHAGALSRLWIRRSTTTRRQHRAGVVAVRAKQPDGLTTPDFAVAKLLLAVDDVIFADDFEG